MAEDNPLLNIFAITLFTEDAAASKEFYTSVFGAKVVHEDGDGCALRFKSIIINCLISSAAHELVGADSVAKPDSGKRIQLAVRVEDVESEMEKLKAKGVSIRSGPEVMPWNLKVVTFEDPGGHVWEFGQEV